MLKVIRAEAFRLRLHLPSVKGKWIFAVTTQLGFSLFYKFNKCSIRCVLKLSVWRILWAKNGNFPPLVEDEFRFLKRNTIRTNHLCHYSFAIGKAPNILKQCSQKRTWRDPLIHTNYITAHQKRILFFIKANWYFNLLTIKIKTMYLIIKLYAII